MAVGKANGAVSQSETGPELQTFTIDDLKQHTTEKSCWLSIRGSVYDVTDFLEEHPGGYDIIVAATGRDATDDYEDINHSRTADDMLKSYLIGSLAEGEVKATQAARPVAARPPVEVTPSSTLAKVLQVLAPLLLVALAVFIKIYGDALKESMAQRS